MTPCGKLSHLQKLTDRLSDFHTAQNGQLSHCHLDSVGSGDSRRCLGQQRIRLVIRDDIKMWTRDNFFKCYSLFCTKEVVVGWGRGRCRQVTKLFPFDEITLHRDPGPTHQHLLTTGKPGLFPLFMGHFITKGLAAREEIFPCLPWS